MVGRKKLGPMPVGETGGVGGIRFVAGWYTFADIVISSVNR